MNQPKNIQELKARAWRYENKEPDPMEELEREKRINESYRLFQTLNMINKCKGNCTCCKVMQVFQEGTCKATPKLEIE